MLGQFSSGNTSQDSFMLGKSSLDDINYVDVIMIDKSFDCQRAIICLKIREHILEEIESSKKRTYFV